jgi:hypothetical protein
MPANTTPVNVNVNFNGVTYSPDGTWTGTPSWNVNPDPVNVPPSKAGDQMTIQWTLRASNLPSGFSAGFASNGILFGSSWTGGPPSVSNSTTISVADTFNNLPANQDYEYSIAIVLTGYINGQYVAQAFTYDPDVENQAGQANLAMRRAAN